MSIQRSQFDISIIKQRDFKMNVYVRDIENEPIPLTGWTGKAQVRERMAPDSPLILEMTVTVADAALGKLSIFCSKENTSVCQESGYWDLVLTNADGESDSYLIGEVTLAVVPTKV